MVRAVHGSVRETRRLPIPAHASVGPVVENLGTPVREPMLADVLVFRRKVIDPKSGKAELRGHTALKTRGGFMCTAAIKTIAFA